MREGITREFCECALGGPLKKQACDPLLLFCFSPIWHLLVTSYVDLVLNYYSHRVVDT